MIDLTRARDFDSLLIDLIAVKTINPMRAAMRENRVDLSIAGDEEDVEIEMGLRQHRTAPKPTPYLHIGDTCVRHDTDKAAGGWLPSTTTPFRNPFAS